MLIDTGNDFEATPTQTLFCFPPFFSAFEVLLEKGLHSPARVEPLAPFHQDPTQQIVVLSLRSDSSALHHLAFRAGTLLKLLEGSEGSNIGWDKWKDIVVVPCLNGEYFNSWVSGCRLFSVCGRDDGLNVLVKVYDFSMQGLANSLSCESPYGAPSPELEAMFQSRTKYLLPTEVKTPMPRFPRSRLVDLHASLGSFVFVSATVLSSLCGCN